MILLIVAGCYLWHKKNKKHENKETAYQQEAVSEGQIGKVAASLEDSNIFKSADILSV